jgi:ATP-dependent RNA helicase DDX31/DBP7
MADDGLLLNFSVNDATAVHVSSVQYKGKWKERALSKKWDRIKAQRALKGPPSRPSVLLRSEPAMIQTPSSQVETGNVPTSLSAESHPLKRKRKHTVAVSSSTSVAPHNHPSSSLFTSNAEIKSPDEPPNEDKPNDVSIAPTNAPLLNSNRFTELGISPLICSHLVRSLSISTPTQIQQYAIPQLLTSSRDTFLRAQTGSGKTLAFVLPILHTLLSLSAEGKQYDRTSGLFAIILAPTRELAKQTEVVLTTMTAGTWIVPGWLLGGERKKSEKARIRKGVNILVATPGRLADHLESTMAFDTSFVRWIVLDEGDRLVDMGFLETVGKILRIVEGRVQHRLMKAQKEGVLETRLPSRLVKVLCSATLRGEEGLGALETIVDPIFLKAESEKDKDTEDFDHVATPGQLSQKAVITPEKLRFVTLCALLTSFATLSPPAKMIVFFSCSTSVDYHHQLLSSFNLDMNIFQLHGSLEQPVRTGTLKTFSAIKGCAILLATDVASRGLDLPYVDMILQFDPPFSQDDYVHRIGRTARAGRTGEGILLLLPSEEEYLASLSSHGARIERIPYDLILKDAFGKDWMNRATTHQLQAEQWVLQDEKVIHIYYSLIQNMNVARAAYQAHLRAYTTHLSTEREIFNVRRIHLGHLAKAFALREAPAEVVAATKRQRMKDAERKMRKGIHVDGIRGEEGGREKLVKKARILERIGTLDEFR